MVFWVIYLTTPNRKAIIEKATELYYRDMAKSGIENFNSPELSELSESGYFASAKSSLMHNLETQHSEWINTTSETSDFTVDIDTLFKSNALVLGSRGIGKSDLAMFVSDRAMKKDAVVVCFDPSRDWQNRSSIPSFQTLVIPYIDKIPTESIVYDISLLSPIESQNVVESFCGRLFRQQAETPDRRKYLIAFEESHVYFPQGCMRAKTYQNIVKLLSVGRNLDISCMLISQFASMLDKFAIKHSTSQAWFGFTREPNDLLYLKQILGSDVKELSKLKDGEFVYLTRNGISKINIEPYESTTQKQRIAILEPQTLPTIDPRPRTLDPTITIARLVLMAIFCAIIAGSLRL